MIYLQLFLSFLQIGMFSFGGGYAAMPLIQGQVVTAHHWLSMEEFTDLITISQMTPGPIAINSATFVGTKIAGTGGEMCIRDRFTVENFIWINLGVFIGSVFAAIPGLTVILCIILFLPFTYKMTAIPGMMFLLGIYCAGGYGGSVSAILINTPGTPHAATTMLDGHPMSEKGRTKAALKIALYASTFGGIFSALTLLFLAPQVAKVAANIGTAEYFLVCVFGLTIIAGISGKSMIKGIISACLGLFISCIGADPQTSYDRFTFGISRLYLGLDLAICLIGRCV